MHFGKMRGIFRDRPIKMQIAKEEIGCGALGHPLLDQAVQHATKRAKHTQFQRYDDGYDARTPMLQDMQLPAQPV